MRATGAMVLLPTIFAASAILAAARPAAADGQHMLINLNFDAPLGSSQLEDLRAQGVDSESIDTGVILWDEIRKRSGSPSPSANPVINNGRVQVGPTSGATTRIESAVR